MKNTVQLSRWRLRKFIISTLLCLFTASAFCKNAQVSTLPFNKGVNLLEWFQTYRDNSLPDLNKYDEEDFACFKSMGIDVVRLTCGFEDVTDKPYGTGKIYEAVLEKLDQVCDWAEKYQIYLIIDNHNNHTVNVEGNESNYTLLRDHLSAIWLQLALRYKDRGEYIIYEIMNEPFCPNEKEWYKLQQDIINLIRTYDKKHSIVVSATDFSGIDSLSKFKPYKDSNLIYTFHFYEPMIFTHQGATWIGDGFEETSGIPFPYNQSRMPELSESAKANPWLLGMYNDYSQIGTENYINTRIKKAADWAKKNKAKILCGEIGDKVWTDPVDRLAWIRTTVSALNNYGIPYCTWGIDGSDGLLNGATGTEVFPDDIDKDALEAYGFTMPDEAIAAKCNASVKQFPQKPFLFYDGFAGKCVSMGTYGSVRSETSSDSHKECMAVSLPGANGNNCRFSIAKTLWNEVNKNKNALSISFSVKFTNANQFFSIGIVDNDEGEPALPWAVEYGLRASDYKLNEWINIEIPLSKLYEAGAWSSITQKWYSPEGKFDWTRVDELRIVFNDYENAMSGDIYIDDLMIKKK